MPEIDGYEVARRFRKIPAMAGTLIIALSGYGPSRIVGNGEVGLLEAVVADVLEPEVVHPGGGAAAERRINKRSDDIPDLRETLARRLPMDVGCFSPSTGRYGSL